MRACRNALQLASESEGNGTFHEATLHPIEQYRHAGRSLARRAVRSTLLLNGLEADVAIVLNPETMDAKPLYIALTRGARQLFVCSQRPVLTP